MILRGPCRCKNCEEQHRLRGQFDCGRITRDELRCYLKLFPCLQEKDRR